MKTFGKVGIAVAATLLVLYTAAAYYFAGVIVSFDTHSLEEDRRNLEIDSPADFGLNEPETLAIPVADGSIAAWLFRNPDAGNCIVIGVHGYSGTRYGALKYMRLFWERGCDVLPIDVRYHGESVGDFGTYGYHERDDVRAIVDWLEQERGYDRARIGLMGESMGAAIVLLAAAELPGIAFVAADSPYKSLPDILKHQGVEQYGAVVLPLFSGALFFAGLQADFDPYDVSPLRHASKIEAPVFISHSRDDAFTPPEHSADIYAAVSHERKVFFETAWGAPHGQSIDTEPQLYAAALNDFLNLHAPNFGRR